MTDAGFSLLLARLDVDRDRAAAAYEQLRRTLEKFFDWQGAWPAEECADETLDRLARKLDADAPIEDVRRYALGIARLVLLEWQRRPRPVPIDERVDAIEPAVDSDPGDDDALQDCFDRCLAELPSQARTLVLEYYVAERRTKIANRRRLAHSLSLSENALRSRVQRVRDRLERCVQRCTESSVAKSSLLRRR